MIAAAALAAAVVAVATDDAEEPRTSASVFADSIARNFLPSTETSTRFRVEISEQAFSLTDRRRVTVDASVSAFAESADDERVRLTIGNAGAPAFPRMSDEGLFGQPPPDGAEAATSAMVADVCPAMGDCVLEFEVSMIPVGTGRAFFSFLLILSGGRFPRDDRLLTIRELP